MTEQKTKKKYQKKTLTPRQAAAQKILLENKGKKPMGKVLREVGYSDSYADNPQLFMATQAYTEVLIKAGMTPEYLAQKHLELANAAEISKYTFPTKLSDQVITQTIESVPGCRVIHIQKDKFGKICLFQAPDHKSRKDALDMAYKNFGNYKPEKIEISDPLRKMTDEELMAEKKKLIAAMKKA